MSNPSKISGTLLGIASGLLLTLSLPKPDFYPLAWVALAPLLVAIMQAPSLWRAAWVSYVAGGVFFGATCYWITETMMVYGGLDVLSSVGIGVLFSVTYALYFVVFGTAVYVAAHRWGPRGVLLASPLWVTVEFMRAHWFTGFPWMLSGYALVPFTGLLQVVSWTGIYGLSFIATAINSLFALAAMKRSPRWLSAAAVAAIILSSFPLLQANGAGAREEPVAVRLVQTNIPLDQAWEKPATDELLDELSGLSEPSRGGRSNLIVWPETPAPFYLNEDVDFRSRIQKIARKSGAYVLLGYVDRIGESPSNSAAVVDREGDIVSRYDKMHLVPFGEYVPLKRLLFFAESLTRQVGDFVPGTEYTISPLDHHRLSTAICYESIFPDLVREFVKRGSELIVVITNDGWFGESSAPFQHLRMGVVRAAENRRYVVRAANTGISAIIDPYGRIEGRTPIGQRMILEGTARFRSDRTFYTEHGDLFAWLNVVASIGLIGAAGIKYRCPK